MRLLPEPERAARTAWRDRRLMALTRHLADAANATAPKPVPTGPRPRLRPARRSPPRADRAEPRGASLSASRAPREPPRRSPAPIATVGTGGATLGTGFTQFGVPSVAGGSVVEAIGSTFAGVPAAMPAVAGAAAPGASSGLAAPDSVPGPVLPEAPVAVSSLPGIVTGTSVFSAGFFRARVITTMLMRRFTALRGFSLSNSTETSPPRGDLGIEPAASSARRAALARSVDRSQFVKPVSPAYGVASV